MSMINGAEVSHIDYWSYFPSFSVYIYIYIAPDYFETYRKLVLIDHKQINNNASLEWGGKGERCIIYIDLLMKHIYILT